ncbi:MAG: HypC/HybG/HupF family hydrogenase formation chaperone [Oscillospiraceae bacterium]|nr:HypC/HybG/HupF family hydrogenase formation chaperone [Oscillospiraceae bacterium]
MCVAVPGKLVQMDGGRGKADIRGNILPVELGVVKAKIGDYILIHAGCAINVLRKSEADEINELFDLIDEYGK